MSTPPLPLSIWRTAQQTSRTQRTGRYLPASMKHPAKMLPAIARTAIAAYTRPDDLVVDPMCGIGTTLVEAVHLDRRGFGIEYEHRWAELARANLAHAAARDAPGDATVVTGDGRDLPDLLPADQHGQVALVLTSPPYGPSLHGHVRTRPGRGVTKTAHQYSRDRTNLGNTSVPGLLDAVAHILAASVDVLRPGGYVVLTARPWRRHGELIDLPGHLQHLAEQAGLVAYERHVALLAAIRGDQLVPRASFFQQHQVRQARSRGVPHRIVAHEDVLVFRRP